MKRPWTQSYKYKGYYVAARRYEISLWVLKKILRVSAANEWNIFQHSKRNFVSPGGHVILCLFYKHQWNTKSFHKMHRKVRFLYITITTVSFSRVKISCFRAKAHSVFHWCLYNNCKCFMDQNMTVTVLFNRSNNGGGSRRVFVIWAQY